VTTCQAPRCATPLPPGRRLYCCDVCRQVAAWKRADARTDDRMRVALMAQRDIPRDLACWRWAQT
jgi:epoxyqueuosine reductase QueG